jgi:hypothetical protein
MEATTRNVFVAVRNLRTAAGDGADSSAVAAAAIANFIRDEARKPAPANYDAPGGRVRPMTGNSLSSCAGASWATWRAASRSTQTRYRMEELDFLVRANA